MRHLASRKLVFNCVHSQIHYQVWIRVQQRCQGIERPLAYRVIAQIDYLKLGQDSELVEKLNSSFICNAALLESQLLELVAERRGCCDHLGPMVFDESVRHIDGQLVVFHAFF